LSSWFHITYVQNHGAAFGLFQHKLYLFIGVAILSVIVIVYYSRYLARDNRWVQVALAFLLSGAVGNMIDRLQYGYVVDFLDFRFWPVFNFADIVINIGVGMLLVEMFWEQQEDEEDEEILDGGMTSA
jgi:signal peptidase II